MNSSANSIWHGFITNLIFQGDTLNKTYLNTSIYEFPFYTYLWQVNVILIINSPKQASQYQCECVLLRGM